MSIRYKMIIGGGALAVIPALIGCLFLAKLSIQVGQKTIEEDAKQSLIAIREITATEIVNYLHGIEKQAKSLSYNLMTIDAMKQFSEAFTQYAGDIDTTELAQRRASLERYYKQSFHPQYRSLNGGQSTDINSLMNPLDKESVALQYTFISNNHHDLGNKHGLTTPDEQSNYSQFHQKYHPVFKQFIEDFGYYDLFLVDSVTGDIVYSVFKELDYTTSLVDGPYADSGIGEAFKRANLSGQAGFTGLTDFSPYLPSYNAPASFIASPIFDGGQKVGVLILQMPVDKINTIMTYDGQWKNSGLGESGETYLVGQDFTMRSNGRFLLEDKTGYLDLMNTIGLDDNLITSMGQKETSIGLQPVKTLGTERALGGESGFDVFPDYRGIDVLSAYKPINIGGLSWAIMSEIDKAEAFEPVNQLKKSIFNNTISIISFALLVGPFLGWMLARTVTTPIQRLTDAIHDMAKGEGDLTYRIPDKGSDELSDLSRSLNQFVAHLDDTFSALINSAMRLVPMSEGLAEGNMAITQATTNQNEQIKTVENRLSVAKKSTIEVNEASELINEHSQKGIHVVHKGVEIFRSAEQEMSQLEVIISETVSSIDQLKIDSDNIVSVIDVINSIADQTNLLALNAAIEAARAGETGRGFAVVADEVRALASRTSEATLEVSSMIKTIQSGTDTVFEAMTQGKQVTESCNNHVSNAKDALSSIDNAIAKISDGMSAITAAVSAQDENFDKVASDFSVLDEHFNKSQKASAVTVKIGEDMSQMSFKLHEMVSHFKLSDESWSAGSSNKG